jgi:hypothetical protein
MLLLIYVFSNKAYVLINNLRFSFLDFRHIIALYWLSQWPLKYAIQYKTILKGDIIHNKHDRL